MLTPRASSFRVKQAFPFHWLCTAVLLSASLQGCVHPVREMYAKEYSCTVAGTTLEPIGGGRFKVRGCAGPMIYQCAGNACFPDTRAAVRSPAPVKAQSSAASEGKNKRVKRSKHKDGYTVMTVELPLDKTYSLLMRAAPQRFPDAAVLEVSRGNLGSMSAFQECEIMLMVNNQRIEVDPATFGSKRLRATLSTKVSRKLLFDIGQARQLAVRVCDERWTLDQDQRARIGTFVQEVEEELAWAGEPRKGTTGGLTAPAGGWPDWMPPSQSRPVAIPGAALQNEDLYRRLMPSVYKITATVDGGDTSQGSAIAISANELLTNCHVIAGGRRLLATQGKKEFEVTVEHSDPETDRCILGCEGVALNPVGGVRAYSELSVGEAVYTLGAPLGLDATLAQGIISALRAEGDVHLVQTTASISPGSSGGGLFDARGNLIGITQMVHVNQSRTSQALNFAIPADAFWQP